MIDILDKLLCLNPYFRSSASEAVKWKVFDEFNNKKKSNAPRKLKLEVDRDDAFDYEKSQSKKYVLKDYKQMVFEIADKVHKRR